LGAGRPWASLAEGFRALLDRPGEGVRLASQRATVYAAKPALKPHPLRVPYVPRVLLLQFNKRCNLFCGFCDHYKFELDMPLPVALGAVEQARAIGIRSLVITGGEPFLHKGIFDLIAAAKDAGLGLNITTNGTTLKAHAEKIAALAVDSLSISIDGPGELHDEIRGRAGTRAKIDEGFAALEATGRSPRINIYTVVTRRNVFHLDTLHAEARARGFGYNFWPVNNAPEMYLQTPEEKAAYLDFCRRVTRDETDFEGRMDYYERGMAYHAGAVNRVRCLGVSDQMGIAVDGTVIPCCVWGEEDKLKIGSVHEQTLADILADPKTQNTMRGIFSHGCDVSCYNHSLYEFELATGESSVVS
jgi:MoaA/NifB/PqqE/SkfB family radical SAM enzyme